MALRCIIWLQHRPRRPHARLQQLSAWQPSTRALSPPDRYDPYKYMRGLVIDKKRGNLLKLDRHKYVKVSAGPRGDSQPVGCS